MSSPCGCNLASPSMRPTALRGVRQMLASLDMPPPSPSGSAGARDGTKLGVRIATAFGEGCEHHWPLQQSGCRARFRLERYLAGGRSGLSAHFRAAGSRSGSSSQTRQTERGRLGATSSGTASGSGRAESWFFPARTSLVPGAPRAQVDRRNCPHASDRLTRSASHTEIRFSVVLRGVASWKNFTGALRSGRAIWPRTQTRSPGGGYST